MLNDLMWVAFAHLGLLAVLATPFVAVTLLLNLFAKVRKRIEQTPSR